MEHLSKSLLVLSEKIKTLLVAHAQVLKDNEVLKNRIFLLEGELSALRFSLEEKRNLLEVKDEDSLFVAMMIDDLLESVSRIHSGGLDNFVLVKETTGSIDARFDCSQVMEDNNVGL
jgi:hypothetical protein